MKTAGSITRGGIPGGISSCVRSTNCLTGRPSSSKIFGSLSTSVVSRAPLNSDSRLQGPNLDSNQTQFGPASDPIWSISDPTQTQFKPNLASIWIQFKPNSNPIWTYFRPSSHPIWPYMPEHRRELRRAEFVLEQRGSAHSDVRATSYCPAVRAELLDPAIELDDLVEDASDRVAFASRPPGHRC